MAGITIDKERCKGCLLCVSFCPRDVIHPTRALNALGYHPVEADRPEKCTGCAICATVCPDVAITEVER